MLSLQRLNATSTQTEHPQPHAHKDLLTHNPAHQANVMLSYPIPEAEELLTNKLSAAQQSLRNCEEDLDFLREQVTVRCVT